MLCEKLIKELSPEDFSTLSEKDQILYLRLYREQVTPRFEEWRNPHRVKCAYGGRGAGAKSVSATSLLIQLGENPGYFGKNIRVLCVREVQKSIKLSSWLLLKDTIARLGYTGWKVTDDKIENTKNGAMFVFNGLNELVEADLKSYQDFDILFAEEGHPIPMRSWVSIMATFRKKGSEIWCLFNRELMRDPCYDLFCSNPEPDWSIIDCKPGPEENPWWYSGTLQSDWDLMKKRDKDEFEHQFLGYPRAQGDKAVFARSRVLAMQDRIVDESGAIEIGCDVARFGKDKTQAFKRKGLRVIDHQERHGFDTVEVAGMLWDMAGKDPSIPIKVDSGYNPGVIDVLSGWGANVISVGFGELAIDEDSYPNAATEMYFELPIDEMSVPAEYMTRELIEDLTERYFIYDNAGRKKIEPKDGTTVTEGGASKQNFKGRHGGRSPDEGDALGLCFYVKDGGGCY